MDFNALIIQAFTSALVRERQCKRIFKEMLINVNAWKMKKKALSLTPMASQRGAMVKLDKKTFYKFMQNKQAKMARKIQYTLGYDSKIFRLRDKSSWCFDPHTRMWDSIWRGECWNLKQRWKYQPLLLHTRVDFSVNSGLFWAYTWCELWCHIREVK